MDTVDKVIRPATGGSGILPTRINAEGEPVSTDHGSRGGGREASALLRCCKPELITDHAMQEEPPFIYRSQNEVSEER